MTLIKRFTFIVLILLLYIIIWRPGRSYLMSYMFKPIVETSILHMKSDMKIDQVNSVSLRIKDIHKPNNNVYEFKTPAGLFFLLSITGLVFIGSSNLYFYLLLFLHVIGGIISFIFFIAGLIWIEAGFYASEFLQAYLIPFVTLALVPLAIVKRGSS